eukprot:CAMPEP_0181520262 /NCGR_PEP_ID=MMETSP1110-20121109/66215_1 /TAXON_ID=174948 /ORGANISM="Symbiodinium sp., Strain CCMP421" /LENGTH=121 /DNA_ID=CAMNT_0023650737 /DNA_START=121 /DNA_END=485 /DNA_ORIENTATION=-
MLVLHYGPLHVALEGLVMVMEDRQVFETPAQKSWHMQSLAWGSWRHPRRHGHKELHGPKAHIVPLLLQVEHRMQNSGALKKPMTPSNRAEPQCDMVLDACVPVALARFQVDVLTLKLLTQK